MFDDRIVLAYSKENQNILDQYLKSKGVKFRVEPNILNIVELVESDGVSSVVFYN